MERSQKHLFSHLPTMNILIDIGHPAHVHIFRCFANEMQRNGHRVFFTCRNKECTVDLLQHYRLPHEVIGSVAKGLLAKILSHLMFVWRVYWVARKHQTDVCLSHGSIILAHVAFLLHKPHIALEDTFNKEQMRLYLPFTKVVLTADYALPIRSPKIRKFPIYNELFYLHPSRFTPQRVLEGRYIVLRLVGWNATHDIGNKGLTPQQVTQAIAVFSQYGQVFISSENPLPEPLKPYQMPTNKTQLHNVLAFATLVFTEGTTVGAESAVLGVPTIVIHSHYLPYIKDLGERYGLLHYFTPSQYAQALQKAESLLQNPPDLTQPRQRMLQEHIDPTAMLCELVEKFQ